MRVPIIMAVSLLLVLSSFAPVTFLGVANATSQVKVPSGIVYYVPVTISNTQMVSTPTPFQQMVTVNSAKFASHEASNLKNIEFFTSAGTIVHSWLESGASRTSKATVYWLKIASGIPAKSSITIYMGFAKTTHNLFNAKTTGEAPQLSKVYGRYDDGANVFPYYWNFAGKLLPSGWKTSVTSEPQAMAYYRTNSKFPILVHVVSDDRVSEIAVQTRINVGVSTQAQFTSIGSPYAYSYELYPSVNYFGQDGEQYSPNNGWGLYAINSANSATFLYGTGGYSGVKSIAGYGYVGAGFSNGYATALYSNGKKLLLQTETQNEVAFSSTNYIWMSTDTAGINPSPAGIFDNNGIHLEVGTGSSGTELILVYATVVSYYPPDGVMPSVSVG